MRDIHDIQGPLSLAFNYFPIIIFLIIILLILTFLIYLSTKQKKPVKNTVRKVFTPKDIALQELEKIRQEKLIEQKKYEVFYNRLTLVLKKYLLQKYTFDTESKTSTEIISNIKSKQLSSEFIKQLELCLSDFDFAKYSSYKTSVEDMNESLNITYNLFKSEQ